MGEEQARGDQPDIVDIERDIERLRKRSESLASELLERAQPSIARIRAVVDVMQQDNATILKAIFRSPKVLGGLGLLLTGALIGALTQRSRERRRLKKTLTGRLLLAIRNE